MFISSCAAMPFCLLLLCRGQEWCLKLVDVEDGGEMAVRPHLRYYPVEQTVCYELCDRIIFDFATA